MEGARFTFDVSLECAADDVMCTAGAGDNAEDVLFVVSLQYLVFSNYIMEHDVLLSSTLLCIALDVKHTLPS